MATAAQQLAITTGGHNDALAHAAINGLNGDIYATWTRFSDDFSTAAVYGRFAWRQEGGSYTLGNEVRISPSGGFHAFAKLDFVPWEDAFAVVWQTLDPGSGLLTGGKIMGRRIAGGGSLRGAARTIVRAKRANVQPHVIATTPWNGAPPPYDENALTLLYTALPTQPGQNKVGIVAQPLRANLKRRGPSTALGGVHLVGGNAPYRFDDLDFQPMVSDAARFQPFAAVGLTTFGFLEDTIFASVLQLGLNATGKPKVIDRTDLQPGSKGPDFADVTVAEDPSRQNDFGATRSVAVALSGFDPEFLDAIFVGDLDGYLLIGSKVDVDGAYLPRNYENDIPTMSADLPILSRSSEASDLADALIGRLIYPERRRMVSREIRQTEAGGLEIAARRRKLFKLDQRKLLQSEAVGSESHPARALIWVEQLAPSQQAIHLYIE